MRDDCRSERLNIKVDPDTTDRQSANDCSSQATFNDSTAIASTSSGNNFKFNFEPLASEEIPNQNYNNQHHHPSLQKKHYYCHHLQDFNQTTESSSLELDSDGNYSSSLKSYEKPSSVTNREYLASDQSQSSSTTLPLGLSSKSSVSNHSATTFDGVHLADRQLLSGSSPTDSSASLQIAPVAHSSEQLQQPPQQHYQPQQQQPIDRHYLLDRATKIASTALACSDPSMALNFSSHDLLSQQSHQGHATLSQHARHNGSADIKPSTGSLELDSDIMQSAAASMWKNTMIGHNFLPPTDMSSFTATWPNHGNNHLGHQATSHHMTHHILEGQHLIGYPQHSHHPTASHHQNSLSHVPNQELVGATLKSQAERATIMLNSINHQVNISSSPNIHPQASHHLTTTTAAATTAAPTNDNLNIRTIQSVDHRVATYNLALNDNHQFYNSTNSRNDSTRSQANPVKAPPVFLTDRSMPMALSNNHHQHHHQAGTIASYHSALNDQMNQHLQATSSHHIASGSGPSNGHSSRNIGSFRCGQCGEQFSMRNQYQSHLKTHSHEKGPKAKFHCEQCGHSFSQKTSLNRHMKSHTGERPFPCEVCGKAFSEKERLKIHMRTHTGEKPFSCGICGKSFSQKSTVKRHQTVHTGEKKFKCDCGKGFANRGNLIAHIKTRGANHFE